VEGGDAVMMRREMGSVFQSEPELASEGMRMGLKVE
jgi:hypothetical protein